MGSISFNTYGMAHSTLNQTLNPEDYVPFNVSDRVSNLMIAQSGLITLSLSGTYLINWWINIHNLDTDPQVANFELKEISPTERTVGWSTSGKSLENNEATVLYGTALVDTDDTGARNFALVNTTGSLVFLNPNTTIGAVITISKIN